MHAETLYCVIPCYPLLDAARMIKQLVYLDVHMRLNYHAILQYFSSVYLTLPPTTMQLSLCTPQANKQL
jgi:hypothetical protein